MVIPGPSEASTFIAPTATTPPQGSYLETNNGYGFEGENGNGFGGQMRVMPAGSQRGMSLDSFFWEYTDDGFSPLDAESNNPNIPEKPDHERSEDS